MGARRTLPVVAGFGGLPRLPRAPVVRLVLLVVVWWLLEWSR